MQLSNNVMLDKAFYFLLVSYVAFYCLDNYMYSSYVIEGKRYYHLFDDMMISMRYANNLANGHGLVWNSGEHVLGVTNVGWTLVMSVVHLLGLPLYINPILIKLLNLFLNISLAVFLYRLAKKSFGPWEAFLAVTLLISSSSLHEWSSNGAECSLVAFLIMLAYGPILCNDVRKVRLSDMMYTSLFIALATVVRLDSAIFFIALIPAVLVAGKSLAADRQFYISMGMSAMLITLMLLLQRAYYGDFLPNTYYLKVTEG